MNSTDRSTIRQLTWRQIKAKFSQTILGLGWTIITPLVLLSVYSIVYSQVFKAQWIRPDGTAGDYALFIFSGLVVFTFAAEVINNSTNLIRSNTVLVKRTSVNLAILPIVNVLSASFFLAVSLIPFSAYLFWREGTPPLTSVLFPIPFILLAILLLGFSYILSALSVYFQDLQQLVPLLVTVLLFLSPVFYSITQLPQGLQNAILKINPLAPIIETFRGLIFYGDLPTLGFSIGFSIFSVIIVVLGLKFYMFAAKGFSDVI
jgi:lipopolysaccharide transport system permease protein